MFVSPHLPKVSTNVPLSHYHAKYWHLESSISFANTNSWEYCSLLRIILDNTGIKLPKEQFLLSFMSSSGTSDIISLSIKDLIRIHKLISSRHLWMDLKKIKKNPQGSLPPMRSISYNIKQSIPYRPQVQWWHCSSSPTMRPESSELDPPVSTVMPGKQDLWHFTE